MKIRKINEHAFPRAGVSCTQTLAHLARSSTHMRVRVAGLQKFDIPLTSNSTACSFSSHSSLAGTGGIPLVRNAGSQVATYIQSDTVTPSFFKDPPHHTSQRLETQEKFTPRVKKQLPRAGRTNAPHTLGTPVPLSGETNATEVCR